MKLKGCLYDWVNFLCNSFTLKDVNHIKHLFIIAVYVIHKKYQLRKSIQFN